LTSRIKKYIDYTPPYPKLSDEIYYIERLFNRYCLICRKYRERTCIVLHSVKRYLYEEKPIVEPEEIGAGCDSFE